MMNKGNNPRDTEKSFKTWLMIRMAIFSALIISGLAMSIWVNAANLSGTLTVGRDRDSGVGFFSSFGVALAVAGAVRLVRTARCIKTPESFQKAYTEHIDERNQFVLMKTYYTTAYIFIILLAAAIVATSFINEDISCALSVCMGVFALILTITYRVMDKRY